MSEQQWDEPNEWDDSDMSEPTADDITSTALEAVPVADATVSIVTPLTTDEARELTEAIRSTGEVLYTLIARAHAGRAWEALGFNSWAEYVREEFDMSRSRAYQILDQARVVSAIEAAAPDGAHLPAISEAAARDLKSILGEVVPEIESRTADLPVHEAGQVVEEIVEDYRDKVRDRKEQDALEREEREMDEAERRGFSDTSNGGVYTPPPPPEFDDADEDDDFDPALIRRNVQAAYDLYSALSALKSMPDVESVINTIPPERRVQINDSLKASTDWLAQFQAAWFAQPWQEGNEDLDEDLDEDFEDEDDFEQ